MTTDPAAVPRSSTVATPPARPDAGAPLDRFVGGDPWGVDLLAPLGDAPVLQDPPALDAPGTVGPLDPQMMVLRNLGESDPSGVRTTTGIEALTRAPRPASQVAPAVLGVAILAGLSGIAVRHRVLSRRRGARP